MDDRDRRHREDRARRAAKKFGAIGYAIRKSRGSEGIDRGCRYPLFIRALKQRRAMCSGHGGRPRAGAG